MFIVNWVSKGTADLSGATPSVRTIPRADQEPASQNRDHPDRGWATEVPGRPKDLQVRGPHVHHIHTGGDRRWVEGQLEADQRRGLEIRGVEEDVRVEERSLRQTT